MKTDKHQGAEYNRWRKAVYARDGFRCRRCGSSYKINAHHIYSWKFYPYLRYNTNNGITLCQNCHKAVHKKYGRFCYGRML